MRLILIRHGESQNNIEIEMCTMHHVIVDHLSAVDIRLPFKTRCNWKRVTTTMLDNEATRITSAKYLMDDSYIMPRRNQV